MEKSAIAYIGAITTALAMIAGLAIGKVVADHTPAVPYDKNADGIVDITDVSISIDELLKTVEVAKGSQEVSGADVYEATVNNPSHMYADINADGEITVIDLSLSMWVTNVLMNHFDFARTTVTMEE